MGDLTYEIFGNTRSVQLWSSVRLPFEPNGWIKDARNELRECLRGLVAAEEEILSADYVSKVESFCDVENILIYNVGSSALRDATRKGLIFRRSRRRPPPSPTGRRYPHYQIYALELRAAQAAIGASICSFAFELERLNTSTKPHEVWWSAVRAESIGFARISGGSHFGLRLEVEAPHRSANVSGFLKPFLDGIISAFHMEAQPDAEAVQRLSGALGAEVHEVEDALRSPASPILGDRDLVRAYRGFVKWNPADERCEYCRLVVKASPRTTFLCRVEVLDLANRDDVKAAGLKSLRAVCRKERDT